MEDVIEETLVCRDNRCLDTKERSCLEHHSNARRIWKLWQWRLDATRPHTSHHDALYTP